MPTKKEEKESMYPVPESTEETDQIEEVKATSKIETSSIEISDSEMFDLQALTVKQSLFLDFQRNPITPAEEWNLEDMESDNAKLPLSFGDKGATLIMGRDNPNGMKFYVHFEGEDYLVLLPIEDAEDNCYTELRWVRHEFKLRRLI